MNNRRDFMKFFGVGAVVAPVIGGLASNIGAQAKILVPPTVEIIAPPKLVKCAQLPYDEILTINVEAFTRSGKRYHIECSGIQMSSSVRHSAAHVSRSNPLGYPTEWETTLKLTGAPPEIVEAS